MELIACTKMLHNKSCIKTVVVQRLLVAAFSFLQDPLAMSPTAPGLSISQYFFFWSSPSRFSLLLENKGNSFGRGTNFFLLQLISPRMCPGSSGNPSLFSARSLRGFLQGSGFLHHSINTDTSQLWILIKIKASAQARLVPSDSSIWQMSSPWGVCSFSLSSLPGYDLNPVFSP